MKKIYWRPSKVPRIILVVIACLAIGGMGAVEVFKTKNKQPFYKEKMKASRIMKKSIDVLRESRIKKVGPIDREADPSNSGLIGLPESSITSKFGHLPSKQTSANPNWAGVMVDMLKKAKVREGDTIAAAFSGSFPAINLAVYSAAEALSLDVVAVTSITASSWGANAPQFNWLDMESVLYKKKIISNRSVAASLGGYEDKGFIRSKKKRQILHEGINRNKLPLLEFESIKESIDARLELYAHHSKGKSPGAYINVGGGIISVGSLRGKALYRPGLNLKHSSSALGVDSVMTRFALEGVPVIHMVRINDLADQYGLPQSPAIMPSVGEGDIFIRAQYNLYLTGTVLLVLLLLLYFLLKLDIGYRIFGGSHMPETTKHPEPMV